MLISRYDLHYYYLFLEGGKILLCECVCCSTSNKFKQTQKTHSFRPNLATPLEIKTTKRNIQTIFFSATEQTNAISIYNDTNVWISILYLHIIYACTHTHTHDWGRGKKKKIWLMCFLCLYRKLNYNVSGKMINWVWHYAMAYLRISQIKMLRIALKRRQVKKMTMKFIFRISRQTV